MSDLTSFRSVIELWPSLRGMAKDTGAPLPTVAKWRQRDSIPAEWWSSILSTNVANDNGVTAEKLTALAAREEARA